MRGHLIYPRRRWAAPGPGGAKPQQVRQNADYALTMPRNGRAAAISNISRARLLDRQAFPLGAGGRQAPAQRPDRRTLPAIIELASGRIMGFESLCRMRMPDGRLIEAAHFHEAMKDAHVAIEITERMLERIASAASDWSARAVVLAGWAQPECGRFPSGRVDAPHCRRLRAGRDLRRARLWLR